jgi:hypothetical protein
MNSGHHACKADTLPLESHLQFILLWLFWRWYLSNYLPKLVSTLILPILASQVARIIGVSRQHPAETLLLQRCNSFRTLSGQCYEMVNSEWRLTASRSHHDDIVNIKNLKFLCKLQLDLSIWQSDIWIRSSEQASSKNGHLLVICVRPNYSNRMLLLMEYLEVKKEDDQVQKLRNTDIRVSKKSPIFFITYYFCIHQNYYFYTNFCTVILLFHCIERC